MWSDAKGGRVRSRFLIGRGQQTKGVSRDDTAVLVEYPSADTTIARIVGGIADEQASSVTGEVAAHVRNRATNELPRAAKYDEKSTIQPAKYREGGGGT